MLALQRVVRLCPRLRACAIGGERLGARGGNMRGVKREDSGHQRFLVLRVCFRDAASGWGQRRRARSAATYASASVRATAASPVALAFSSATMALAASPARSQLTAVIRAIGVAPARSWPTLCSRLAASRCRFPWLRSCTKVQTGRREGRRLLHRHLQLLQRAIVLPLSEEVDAAEKCGRGLIARCQRLERRRSKVADFAPWRTRFSRRGATFPPAANTEDNTAGASSSFDRPPADWPGWRRARPAEERSWQRSSTSFAARAGAMTRKGRTICPCALPDSRTLARAR